MLTLLILFFFIFFSLVAPLLKHSASAAVLYPLVVFQALLFSAVLLLVDVSVCPKHTILYVSRPSCSCNDILCNRYISDRLKNLNTVFDNMLCYNIFSASASFRLSSNALLTEKPRSGIALLCESVKAAFATYDRLS